VRRCDALGVPGRHRGGMSTIMAGTARYSPVALLSAAVLTLGAGAIHLAVAPEHLEEYLPFGLFFLVVAAAQIVAAPLLLVRPSNRLAVVVAVGSCALVGLWLVSRTVGLPVGVEPWRPEEVGIPDVVCVLLESAGAAVAGVLAIRGRRPRRRHPVRTPLAAAPVVLLVSAATVVGVGTGASSMPMAFSAGPPTGVPGTVSVTDLVAAPGPQPVKEFVLTAQDAVIDGQPVETYDATVPGPELRVTQGDRVRVTLVNRLAVATTVHWHGVRVPNAADGVAGMTQDAVQPGASYTYEFVATDPGTFWYHSHQDTGKQLPAGLFGALVVEPTGGTAEDVDRTVLLHGDPGDRGRIAVNGTRGDLHVDARPGQTVRLRIIDAVSSGMDGTVEAPVLFGAPYRVVALDGHDLVGPTPLGPERLQLGMGQRADLVFTMPASGAVRLVDSRIPGARSLLQGFFATPAAAAETVTIGDGALPPAVDPLTVQLFDPLTYGTPAGDPTTGPADVTAPVVLAEAPGFHDGDIQIVHSINGAASPDVPPIEVREGQLVRLHMVNTTGEFHPMHLHGHVMSVLDVDGRAPTGSPLHADTLLLAPHQTADVAFRADNPGIWMLHCHVLVHASMGMSMSINYSGVTTPFAMGSRSGNVPE
jgi:FtsP/CotA-like multicopper oxidase with cupredoxin domain